MTRARILADYVSSGDELADKAPLASPTFTGTVAIPNVANLETAVVANTAKVTNATHTGEVTGGTGLTIADNAVSLAKMAGGTDGNLITYDTSGDPAYVATGTSGHVLTSAGADAVPVFAAGGITEVDSFTISADVTANGDITANWLRVTAYGQIGTGLTESSGIFSFPSAGIWYIHFQGFFTVRTSSDYFDLNLFTTTDGSNWAKLVGASSGSGTMDTDNYNHSLATTLDVTSTTNVKFKWNLSSMTTSTLYGGAEQSRFMAIRLGDT